MAPMNQPQQGTSEAAGTEPGQLEHHAGALAAIHDLMRHADAIQVLGPYQDVMQRVRLTLIHMAGRLMSPPLYQEPPRPAMKN